MQKPLQPSPDLACERSMKRTSLLEDQLSSLDSELAEHRPVKARLEAITGQVADLRGERDRLLKLLDEKQSIRKSRKKDAGAD